MQTYFIDLDGTLVEHLAWVENGSTSKERFLPGALDFLKDLKAKGCYCVLTTARAKEECKVVLQQLKDEIGFKFDKHIYLLPAWSRTIVNDDSSSGEAKAFAIRVKRNKGFKNLILS